jgi:hypothetical protein
MFSGKMTRLIFYKKGTVSGYPKLMPERQMRKEAMLPGLYPLAIEPQVCVWIAKGCTSTRFAAARGVHTYV